MNGPNSREGQRIVIQGSSAPNEIKVGFSNPGSINMHDQVSNTTVEMVSSQFEDFITPDSSSSIWVKGRKASLKSLDKTVNYGGRVQRIVRLNQEFAVYAPFVTSINFLCAYLDRKPITERDVIDIQRQSWFEAFLKQFALKHHAEDTINFSRLGDIKLCTGDRMVLLLEALEFAGRLPKVVLGVVSLDKKSRPWVIHYPCSDPQNHHTVWVFLEMSSAGNRYYGFGSATTQEATSLVQLGPQLRPEVHQQQPPQSRTRQQRLLHAPQPLSNVQQFLRILEDGNSRVLGKESDDEFEEDTADADNEAIETPKLTPRKTAARVLARQIPLDAGMSVEDIIKYYPQHVYYSNMLKVALKLSNKDIAKRVHGLTLASGVVKRINTALEFIESEFNIDEDAFRTAFDRERRAADIPTRGKEEVPQDVLDANASKIAAAMAWVKTGGPRPTSRTTIVSVTAGGEDAALSSSMGAAPIVAPHATPIMGRYLISITGAAPVVAHGHFSRFGADRAISTNSQDLAPAFNNDLPGYTPAPGLPVHLQNSVHLTNDPHLVDVFYDYGAVSSNTNHFQGFANTPSHDKGSQMDVDDNMNANHDGTFMAEGSDVVDWGEYMKNLPNDLFG